MKFGMPTLLEYSSISETVLDCKRLGLDFVEINMSFPGSTAEDIDVDKLVSLKNQYGIFYTFHADEGLNPFDFTKSVSECYFELMRKTISVAKAVGAPIINMHLLKGVYVTLPGKVVLLNDSYREEYLSRVREFIKLCELEIGNAPLKISIENVDSNPFTEAQIYALELFMQSPAFSLTYDVGHDACLKGKDKHIIDKYKNKLAHMHLHDAKDGKAHLPLGEGDVNIPEKLSLLPENATCLVEVKTVAGLEASLKYLFK